MSKQLSEEERQARDAEICRLRRQRLSINKIGDRLGCGHHTIVRVLEAHGLSGPEYYSQSARGPKGHVAATHKHGPYKLPQPQLTARRMAQQRNDPALCNRCGCPLAKIRAGMDRPVPNLGPRDVVRICNDALDVLGRGQSEGQPA